MTKPAANTYTAFEGHRILLSGPLPHVAVAVRHAADQGSQSPILIYDDATGRVVDVDTRGTDAEIIARLTPPEKPRGRGRPKLGVTAREVTLLPRHWEWLNAQPGGASVALRKLVDEARRASTDKDASRQRQEIAYRFMASLAGDLQGYEDAIRALFASDWTNFEAHMAAWPEDVRTYATQLAFSSREERGHA